MKKLASEYLGRIKRTGLRKKYGAITAILTKANLEDLYYAKEKSLQDIADEYGCTRRMVQKVMADYGLQRRSRSKARILAIKSEKFKKFEYHDINEEFFKKWSPEMAWVLGLLFTDGHITKSTVSISSIDFKLLGKIKHLLGSTKPISKRIQSYDKSKFIYYFEFYRENMREDLYRLGLVSRKSLIMFFPDIPKEHRRHFIRGCWDGDGSVYITGGKLNADYVTGSRNFIERLVDELYTVGICRKRLHVNRNSLNRDEIKRLRSIYPPHCYPLAIHNKHRAKAYYIKIRSRENIEKLFHYLYDEVNESLYLKRKYEVFMKGLYG